MKRTVFTLLIALMAASVFAKDKKDIVIMQTEGSITFVVDENLPAPNGHLNLQDGAQIANWRVGDGKERKTIVATSFDDAQLYHTGDNRKYVNIYNKKGILTYRKCLVNQGSRFWHGDKIVETEPQWIEVSQDLCDKDGNIILHRDYDTDDTIRYTYSEGHKIIKKEIYRDGHLRQRMEYNYDQHGNVISADNFYIVLMGGKLVEHAFTYTINYNLNEDIADTEGTKQGLHLLIENMKPFILDEIDYMPLMHNIPVRITSYSDEFEEEMNAYFHYSYGKNE